MLPLIAEAQAMALYFFHVFDGNEIRQVAEAECASLAVMRIRMMERALDLVEQSGETLSSGWSMEVRDNRGLIVSMLEMADYPRIGAPTIRLL